MACWCKGDCPVIRNVNSVGRRGRNSEAERQLKTALLDAPNCVEANIALAELLGSTNRGAFAHPHLERARATGGDTVALALATARVARSETKIPEAIELFQAAVAAAPDNPRAHAGLVSALEADGRYSDAVSVGEGAYHKFPESRELRQVTASARAAAGNHPRAIEILTGATPLRPVDLLDRGRYRDREQLFEQAWGDWDRARAMMRNRNVMVFDRDGFNARIEALSKLAHKKRFKSVRQGAWTGTTIERAQPLFITGFPRSGTTMIETAIAAHSAIAAGDELPFIPELVNIMPGMLQAPAPYPAAMVASNFGENVAGFGLLYEWYMRKAAYRLGPLTDKKFFTDKMPLNEMHLPLILTLFPKSPVFFVRRHPLDVMVSNYSHFIQHGFGYGASLDSAAHVYAAIDALVQQYKLVWPGKLVEVRYENFIADHRAALGEIFAAIPGKLQAEPACYDFHLSPRHSRTISQRQIKEPLYDRSVGRWKNYRAQLAPVIEVLRPIIEREGYEL